MTYCKTVSPLPCRVHGAALHHFDLNKYTEAQPLHKTLSAKQIAREAAALQFTAMRR
jgi:hypothetical protein